MPLDGFNPRSPRGGATAINLDKFVLLNVSIHAPHEGERLPWDIGLFLACCFNPRSPRGGATWLAHCSARTRRSFNPRSPRGGATPASLALLMLPVVSIHAPHEGERLLFFYFISQLLLFQSTLPTRGSDILYRRYIFICIRFQSTLPTRGSDVIASACFIEPSWEVSIHAPHEGERRRKSAFVCSISANLLNIIHCGTVTRAVSRRRIALFRLFSVRRSGVFMYAYASH